MKRRSFLKGTLVTAGAVVVGCSDDDGAQGADAASGDTTGPDAADAGEEPDLITDSGHFPQSVASGDPKPASVVLWTRVQDDARPGEDLTLRLEMALDEAFAQRVTLDGGEGLAVGAEAAYDHCARVIVEGLMPATTYYYRFVYEADGARYATRVGRTKTAPAADADVPARFAFVSCQDYSGHYYNTYRRLLQLDDVDFVVHLGDYIYETTDNPTFQDSAPGRAVTFSDPTGAIAFNEGTDEEYFAAATVEQYREIYKTYRRDPDLQRIHERFPMVLTWDDHEYSDDSHGATSTYFAGLVDETTPERRKAASQAWFEYMPIDYRTPDFTYDPQADFPNDISIYRDLQWGRHLHVVMTDLRTRRADHLIDEAAFPGAVAVTQAEIEATLGELPDFARPYVDIATYAGGIYETVLLESATAGGYLATDVTGLIAVDFINPLVTAWNEAQSGEPVPLIDPEEAGLGRGLAYLDFGKRSAHSSLGSRYLVARDAFDVYARVRWAETSGDAQTMMGDAQRDWFVQTIQSSPATWKVWGNEFMLMPLSVDLSTIPSLPDAFRKRFYILVEDWNGTPQRRDQLLDALSGTDNVVAITGDIHAFFAGNPRHSEDPDKRLVELVTAGIASNSLKTLLLRTALSDPVLADAGAGALAVAIKSLLKAPTIPNPHLAFAEPGVQGFAVVEAGADALEATYHLIDEEHVQTDLGEDLEGVFTTERFRVEAGARDLYRWIDGAWKRWDPSADDYV